jgi:hypothetical protein
MRASLRRRGSPGAGHRAPGHVPTIASPITTVAYTYAAEPPSGGLCVVGPPGPARPATHFIAGTLTEVGHHGTQIGALRDLYAWRHFNHDRA